MKKKIVLSCVGCVILLFFGTVVGDADISIYTSSPFLGQEDQEKTISMDFEDAELVDVLKIFSEQTKYNLITAENVASKKLTVYLDNVPVEQALEQVLRANDLTYELQPGSNIYIVKPLSQPDVEMVTRVYPLKFATVSKAKLKQTLNIGADESGSGGASSEGGGGGGGGSGIQNEATSGILDAVKGILTTKGKVIEDPRTNSLIISDIAANFPLIEKTISRLDIPVPQVLIEVEMLEVSKETADKIGIKPGSDPQLTFEGATRSVLYPFDQNRIVGRGDYSFTDQYTAGTLDASGFAAALQFLKTQTDSKTLARPRILTLNNETAEIKIATKEAIGVSNTTSGTAAVGTSATEAERVQTGVFLTVTPQANPETSDITMAVIPKVIVARTGGTFQGQTFKDPEERTAQSLLKVKSGETIVIGGLLREDKTNVVTKIPLLGDIPFLGRAFRYNDNSNKERELIIFLTPHILTEKPVTAMAVNAPRMGPRPRMSDHVMVREQERPGKQTDAVNRELSAWKRKKRL